MKKATNWNSPEPTFFSEQSREYLSEFLPEWDIHPMVWPTNEEIKIHLGAATEAQKEECVTWIRKHLKDEWVPEEITSYLLPLRKWAKHDAHWPEKGKIDVFLCRYTVNNYLIQIMEGSGGIIITIKEISDKPPVKKDGHKNFVSQIFKFFWNGGLSELLLAQQQPVNITKGGIRSGKTALNFITDGKFVQFDVQKILPGKRIFPDPYESRFKNGKK